MRLIEPSFEIIKQEVPVIKLDKDKWFIIGELIANAKKQIELAGRVCYKSEDKITDKSYEDFFKMIRKKQHLSVLEHGTLYFSIKLGDPILDRSYMKKAQIIQVFRRNPYSKIKETMEPVYDKDCNIVSNITRYDITTNYRVVEENFNSKHPIYVDGFNTPISDIKEQDLFEYLVPPSDNHAKRTTVKFICSRAISHELVRHRVFSFSQESQRYCNYSKDKYGMEITFILPEFEVNIPRYEQALTEAEYSYFYLLSIGQTPQEAREVLPNSTKTEVVMTGFDTDWEEFFKLRTSEAAHPEMRRLVIPLKESWNVL